MLASKTEIDGKWAGEMARWVKEPVAKADDLSLIDPHVLTSIYKTRSLALSPFFIELMR